MKKVLPGIFALMPVCMGVVCMLTAIGGAVLAATGIRDGERDLFGHADCRILRIDGVCMPSAPVFDPTAETAFAGRERGCRRQL